MKDFELLKNLYEIHSPSYGEKRMRKFVRRIAMERGGQCQTDNFGNLYVTKGVSDTYPCICAHLDQVQDNHSKDFTVFLEKDIIFAFSPKSKSQQGLGADDKNGIWICLRCLKECPRLKVFMAVGEEKGCIGSNRADMSFFADSLYVLEPDCKGGKEIHINLRGIPCASKDFEDALKAETNGYEITDGKTSDILALTLNNIGVSCANIPAGYYQPHKDDEYTIMSDLEHALSYIKNIVTYQNRRFPHVYKSETQIYAERFLKKIRQNFEILINSFHCIIL